MYGNTFEHLGATNFLKLSWIIQAGESRIILSGCLSEQDLRTNGASGNSHLFPIVYTSSQAIKKIIPVDQIVSLDNDDILKNVILSRITSEQLFIYKLIPWALLKALNCNKMIRVVSVYECTNGQKVLGCMLQVSDRQTTIKKKQGPAAVENRFFRFSDCCSETVKDSLLRLPFISGSRFSIRHADFFTKSIFNNVFFSKKLKTSYWFATQLTDARIKRQTALDRVKIRKY